MNVDINDVNKKLDDIKENMCNDINTFTTKVTNVFTTLQTSFLGTFDAFAKKVQDVVRGFNIIFHGLFETSPKGLGDGLKRGFDDMGEFMFWTSEFIFIYIICGLQYIKNLDKCIFYYIFDAFAKMLYFPIDIISWVAWELAGQDLYTGQKKIWDTIYWIDDTFYNNTGFHFAHYPKNVVDMCYSCKRLKILALKNKSSQIKYDFEKNLPSLLQSGISEIRYGADITDCP